VRSRPDDLFDDSDREKIHNLFQRYLPETLKYFKLNLKSIVYTNDISLSISILKLLDSILTRLIVIDDTLLESVFVFCIIWGFGSILTIHDNGHDNRKLFNDWFRSKFKTVKVPSR
jgi:dynein heavy chain